MSLQIVQNQQLKPIGDKVAIDTQLSTTSENAISNKAVTEEINRINSDLTVRDISSDLTVVTGMLKSAYRYGNVVSICVRYDNKDSATLITGLPTPVGTVETDCVTYNINGKMNSGLFSIQSNGTLSYNNFYNQNSNVAKNVTITYIAND